MSDHIPLPNVPGETIKSYRRRLEKASTLFASIQLYDRVQEVPRGNEKPKPPFHVISYTAKRFVCDIGLNESTGQRMRETYRRSDGRSVGNRHHVTIVVPYIGPKG